MSRLPFLGRLPIIGRLFRSDEFRSKRSDLVIFVTPMISDPTLAPNTDLLARADRIDRGFHERHGDPSPLAERDRARGKDEPRQAIGPTRPQPVGPLRAQTMQDDRGDASGSPVSSRVPPRPAPAPTRPARGEAASFGPASPSAQRRLLDGIDAPAQGSLPRNGAPPPPVAESVTIPATPIEWRPAKSRRRTAPQAPSHDEPATGDSTVLSLQVQLRHGAPQVVRIEDGCTIGKSPECDVVIKGMLVGRIQARIVARGNAWYLEDQGGIANTLVNGAPIETFGPLTANDEIEIGTAKLRVVAEPSSPAQAAADTAGDARRAPGRVCAGRRDGRRRVHHGPCWARRGTRFVRAGGTQRSPARSAARIPFPSCRRRPSTTESASNCARRCICV
ncbi:FHA domain-containing protein [Burkholderia gladioli]